MIILMIEFAHTMISRIVKDLHPKTVSVADVTLASVATSKSHCSPKAVEFLVSNMNVMKHN